MKTKNHHYQHNDIKAQQMPLYFLILNIVLHHPIKNDSNNEDMTYFWTAFYVRSLFGTVPCVVKPLSVDRSTNPSELTTPL